MTDASVVQAWQAAWPQALALWGRWTRLAEPTFAQTPEAVQALGLEGTLAWIKMDQRAIEINLIAIAKAGLQDFPLQFLAHEIGHHVLAPSTLLDHFRILAQVGKGLPTLAPRVPEVANLWTDLCVNDHLHRILGVPMDGPYRQLRSSRGAVWNLYMRCCECLWALPLETLCDLSSVTADRRDLLQADAWLASRTVRVYAADPVRGAGRFAALLLPWIALEKQEDLERFALLADTRQAGAGCIPPMGLGLDDLEAPPHPSNDPAITGLPADAKSPAPQAQPGSGQWHEPWQLGELLKLGGIEIDPQALAVRYYRERALPHLVACPSVVLPSLPDPLPEGLDPWESGDPFETLDVFQSLLLSPVLVPGVTTVARHWGEQPGVEKHRQPVDLDLYIDSSGSMPDPKHTTSYPALAGAIVAISTLRRGGRVQVTLWSGKGQCLRTPGFLRDEDQILGVICSHFGGGTTFPLHALRQSWGQKSTRRAHILHLSDDGLSSLFDDRDERGNLGWDIANKALEHCRGGGTMALQIDLSRPSAAVTRLLQARDQQGWDLHAVSTLEGLLEFARNFSANHGRREIAP